MIEVPHRCFTCKSFGQKYPPRSDVSDSMDYCKTHKKWFQDPHGEKQARPGMRGSKCGAWAPDLELLEKMKEYGTEFKEVAI